MPRSLLIFFLVSATSPTACGQGGGRPDSGADALEEEAPADDPAPEPQDEPLPDGPACAFIDCFVRYTVDTTLVGPAWASVDDVDGDGQLDIVVSAFGAYAVPLPPGRVVLYRFDGDLTNWRSTEIAGESEGIRFPNQTTIHDVDGDGDLDVVVPAGFLACTMGGMGAPCGALAWFEQAGTAWIRHDVVAGGSALFYHHVEIVDMTGDGLDDMVTVGEEMGAAFPPTPDRAVPQIFRGAATAARFETTPVDLTPGLGSAPVVHDIDGDADADIASAEFFVEGGSFAWLENQGSAWTRHVIATDPGPSIMLQLVPDLYGDGVLRALGSNHVNEGTDGIVSAVFAFDIPENPRDPWPHAPISTGIVSAPGTMIAPMAAPGIFGWGDLDGDGDIDVAVSGDGDKRAFVLEQVSPGSFVTHVLEDPLGQAGGMVVTDLDADGAAEIVVTGYEDGVVYVYEHQG